MRADTDQCGMTTPANPNPPAIPASAMVLALAATLVVGGGVTYFYWNRDHVARQIGTAASHTADVPSGRPTELDDKDSQFLDLLAARGLQLSRSASAAVTDAHRVCSRVAQGDSKEQIAEDIFAGSPSMSMATATNFATVAITVYCPQIAAS